MTSNGSIFRISNRKEGSTIPFEVKDVNSNSISTKSLKSKYDDAGGKFEDNWMFYSSNEKPFISNKYESLTQLSRPSTASRSYDGITSRPSTSHSILQMGNESLLKIISQTDVTCTNECILSAESGNYDDIKRFIDSGYNMNSIKGKEF
jgi:hypothetical protein